MGNRISIRKRSSRRAVEERFTRPQRLILEPSNVNYKKLRKLILKEKLAPCFDVVEESNPDLEECPICCFYFPSLNRSRCCMKGICTECFLQMKPSNNSMRPAQCPFCKCSIYAVEYRGARTQEERNVEQAEEQKVIEAKIRMRSEESQEVNRVTQTLAEQILSDAEVQSPLPSVWQQPTSSGNAQDLRDWQLSFAQERIEGARHEDFDVDLEEIMIAEAIWQSMQQANASQPSGPSCMGGLDSACHGSNERRSSLQLANQVETTSTESVTGGLAYAIARFAEQNIQQSPRLQSVLDNDMPEQADENFAEDDRSMQDTISPNDVGSETQCTGSSLTTDDVSWGSLAASLLEENQTSETGFVSDVDLVEEAAEVTSCSASSIHSVSDISCDSPDCSDDDADVRCSHFSPTTAVKRPLVVISDLTS